MVQAEQIEVLAATLETLRAKMVAGDKSSSQQLEVLLFGTDTLDLFRTGETYIIAAAVANVRANDKLTTSYTDLLDPLLDAWKERRSTDGRCLLDAIEFELKVHRPGSIEMMQRSFLDTGDPRLYNLIAEYSMDERILPFLREHMDEIPIEEREGEIVHSGENVYTRAVYRIKKFDGLMQLLNDPKERASVKEKAVDVIVEEKLLSSWGGYYLFKNNGSSTFIERTQFDVLEASQQFKSMLDGPNYAYALKALASCTLENTGKYVMDRVIHSGDREKVAAYVEHFGDTEAVRVEARLLHKLREEVDIYYTYISGFGERCNKVGLSELSTPDNLFEAAEQLNYKIGMCEQRVKQNIDCLAAVIVTRINQADMLPL